MEISFYYVELPEKDKILGKNVALFCHFSTEILISSQRDLKIILILISIQQFFARME